MNSISFVLALFSLLFTFTLAQNPLELIGKTATKEFYITSATGDFAFALRHICPERYGMQLATIESPEEFQVIDAWYSKTYGNGSYEKGWTSAFRMGAVPLTWASNGKSAAEDLSPYTISFPWMAGGWNGANYSGNNCISVYRKCNRPPNSPPGCWPLRTELFWSDCKELNRVICQKNL